MYTFIQLIHTYTYTPLDVYTVIGKLNGDGNGDGDGGCCGGGRDL